jgi:hypothetical protein
MKKIDTSSSESEVTLAESSSTNGASAVPITAKLELQLGPPHTHASVPETPPRLIKKGSPADAFLMTLSPTTSRVATTEVFLTCDLRAVPKENWNRKFNLAAVVISAQPIIKTDISSRRYVVLRDEASECIVCLWNNFATVITEDCVGRAVLLMGVTLNEYDGGPQLKLAKTATISVGKRPETRCVQEWYDYTTALDAIPVPDAMSCLGPQIISVKGICARVVEQSITTLGGSPRNLLTLYVAFGPPLATICIQFWNPASNLAAECQSLLHRPIVVTKIRAYIDTQRGSTFESIGRHSTVSFRHDGELELWWSEPD